MSYPLRKNKTLLLCRSLIFWMYSLFSICLFSVIVVCSCMLPLRIRHAEVRAFLRSHLFMLNYICQINYRVEGLSHIPIDRGGVVLCKHQSTWETFFLPLLFHDPAIILKRELCWIPFFGWGLALIDPISINRSHKTSAMEQIITKGRKCLQNGRWVIIFPEGTRMPVGKEGHYKSGGARLATATGYPVIPVAHNAGRYWPRRKFIKQPGTIQVVIGPLIDTQNRTTESVLKEAKTWIENTMKLL